VARPTILLLHAFPLDSRMWNVQRRALEANAYEVVAPDLPGEPPDIGLDSWARRVLGEVSGRLLPVGCSIGGYLAFELWRQAPERIAALGLVDTRATPDTPEQRQGRDDTIRLLGEAGFEPFWERTAPNLFAGDDPGARAIASEQPITGLVAALETLRDRPDSRETLPTIDVPVLVVVGEEDRLTPPADAEAMVAALPDARLLRIAGAGHLTPLERPEALTEALVGFVREVAP
jgi:pimeloyl-ACP methyl ester carboxylesterase